MPLTAQQRLIWQSALIRVNPAAWAALAIFILATCVIVANHRRSINRIWGANLFFLGLWQLGIAAISWVSHAESRIPILRCVFISGALSVATVFLLREAILAPWRSLKAHLLNLRVLILFLLPQLLVFSKWFLAIGVPGTLELGPGMHRLREGFVFETLNLFDLFWACLFVVQTIALTHGRSAGGIARHQLRVVVFMVILLNGTFLIRYIARLSGAWKIGYFSPFFLVAGLIPFTLLLIWVEVFDGSDVRKTFALFRVRLMAYIPLAGLSILLFMALSPMTISRRVLCGFFFTLLLYAAPVIDRELRKYVNRRLPPQDFFNTQALLNAMIERSSTRDDLRADFAHLLGQWSDGSEKIFLSERARAPEWPCEPIPIALFDYVSEAHWATPEILDRRGGEPDGLAYMVKNEVGAIVSFKSQSGDRLTAAFSARVSRRPFVSRELRETHELLRVMQFALASWKSNRKLRGNERLGFYAQYGGQFAHELRNGLYLQTQLLRAVAQGRAMDVDPSDAQLAVDRLDHVDRLCSHFFDVGALFNRPLSPVLLNEELTATIKRADGMYAKAAGVELRLRADTPSHYKVTGSSDLLSMALLNLLKNSVEALADSQAPRVVQVSAKNYLSRAHITIEDNGPGVPAGYLINPFAPAMTQKPAGMGLGLSIARDCVEAMGGTISVRNIRSRGACFEITLNGCADVLASNGTS